MSATSRESVSISLPPGQRAVGRRATGRDAETLEVPVLALEERVVPRLAANHNETRLANACGSSGGVKHKKPKSSAWLGMCEMMGWTWRRHRACTNPFFNIPTLDSPCFCARVPTLP